MSSNTKFTIQPVMQRFSLLDDTKNDINNLTPKFGFNGLGEVVFRRTYSRDNESWNDVVVRVVEGVMSIHKEHFTRASLEWNDDEWQPFAKEMALSLFHMEWLPPGRGLWMMGTQFTYDRGSTALNNCSATDTKNDLVHSAEWTMDCLMNGVGVGFSTHWRGSASVPNKEDYETFIIPDSREGWVQSLIKLLCSYIDSPKYGKNKFPKFDYSQIREKGLPIKGFGGSASGPEPLQKMHERIEGYLDAFCAGKLETTATTYKQVGDEWKPEEVEVSKNYGHSRLVADIFNSIGACVVAGNVRRSAEIALGDVEDQEFINLKNYELNPERGEIGWMSNNSVVLRADQDYEDFSYIPDMKGKT
jgi:ribonucleoside-diphosphate reductase alpha chain